MRSFVICLILTFPLVSLSQGVFSNNAHTALQKVIGDYPNRFKNIRGEVLNRDLQTTDYNSKVQIPGSVRSTITQYRDEDKKEVYSWKCLLAESDDFEAVSGKYKALFNQIKNSIVKLEGEKPYILNGTYETPTQEKKFTTSVFYLLPATGEMKKIKIELTLEYYITEWKVALLVYDREKENNNYQVSAD